MFGAQGRSLVADNGEKRAMRWVRRILKWLGLGGLGLLVLGAAYQQIGLLLDAGLGPPPGDMVSVNGRTVHLVCTGQGKRTFLLDAGAGAGVFEWFRVQPLLAKAARVCAFDRAGLGWSAAAPGGYDGLAAAAQLAALVRAAKIPTPFVYMGHSLGANFAIVYRAEYPQDVSALVLIEPGRPADLLEGFHGTRDDAMVASDCGLSCYAAGAANLLGVVRLASHMIGHKTFDEYHRALYQAYLARPATLMTTLASLNAVPKTAYEDMDVRSFGNTPVIVFASSDNLRGDDEFKSVSAYLAWRKAQHTYLASLAAMSKRGSGPVVIPNSDHASMVLGGKQSAILVQQIIAFVEANSR
jgi:pimeloyl-ACP methyl ester carboxylesterase